MPVRPASNWYAQVLTQVVKDHTKMAAALSQIASVFLGLLIEAKNALNSTSMCSDQIGSCDQHASVLHLINLSMECSLSFNVCSHMQHFLCMAHTQATESCQSFSSS